MRYSGPCSPVSPCAVTVCTSESADHDLDAEALGGEAAHELEEVKGRRREEVEVWEEIEMCPLRRPAAMSKLTLRSPPRKEDMSRVMKAMMSAQERTPNASSDRKPASRTWCTLAARRPSRTLCGPASSSFARWRPGPRARQPRAPSVASQCPGTSCTPSRTCWSSGSLTLHAVDGRRVMG